MTRCSATQVVFVIVGGLLLSAAAGISQPSVAKEVMSQGDHYSGEITRHGTKIIVSRRFVNAIEKNNAIILSKVAVKQRLDKDGKLAAWELVEVDRGSLVDKMGFRWGDRLTKVNGIPVRELDARRTELQTSRRWDLTLLRHGKPRKMVIEVRD